MQMSWTEAMPIITELDGTVGRLAASVAHGLSITNHELDII
jgi:hypothetical protein